MPDTGEDHDKEGHDEAMRQREQALEADPEYENEVEERREEQEDAGAEQELARDEYCTRSCLVQYPYGCGTVR